MYKVKKQIMDHKNVYFVDLYIIHHSNVQIKYLEKSFAIDVVKKVIRFINVKIRKNLKQQFKIKTLLNFALSVGKKVIQNINVLKIYALNVEEKVIFQ